MDATLLQQRTKAKVRTTLVAALQAHGGTCDLHTVAASICEELSAECKKGTLFPNAPKTELQELGDAAPELDPVTVHGEPIVDLPGYMSGAKNADGSEREDDESAPAPKKKKAVKKKKSS